MAKRSIGLGIETPSEIVKGRDHISDEDLMRRLTGEVQDKGFVSTNLDSLVAWARTGFAMANDFRACLLCR